MTTSGVGSGLIASDELIFLQNIEREDDKNQTTVKLYFSDGYYSKLIDNKDLSFKDNSRQPVVMLFKDKLLSSIAFNIKYNYETKYNGKKISNSGTIEIISIFDYSPSVSPTQEQRRYFGADIEQKNVTEYCSITGKNIYDYSFFADKIIIWTMDAAKIFNLSDGVCYDSFSFDCFPSGYAFSDNKFLIYSRNDDKKAVLYDLANKSCTNYYIEEGISSCGFTGENPVFYLKNGKTRIYGAEGVRELSYPDDNAYLELVYNRYLKKSYLIPYSSDEDKPIYEILDAPSFRLITDYDHAVLAGRIYGRRNGFILEGGTTLYDKNFKPVKQYPDDVMCGNSFFVDETDEYIITSQCVYDKNAKELYKHDIPFNINYDQNEFWTYDGKFYCKTSFIDRYAVAFGKGHDIIFN